MKLIGFVGISTLLLIFYQGLVDSLSCYKCYTIQCPGKKYMCDSMEQFILNELHAYYFIEGSLPKCPEEGSPHSDSDWTYLQQSSPSWIPCSNSITYTTINNNNPQRNKRNQKRPKIIRNGNGGIRRARGQLYQDQDDDDYEDEVVDDENDPDTEPNADDDQQQEDFLRPRPISQATCSVGRFQVISFLNSNNPANYELTSENVTSWGTVLGCLRREVLIKARESRLKENKCIVFNSTNYFRGVIDHVLRIEHCPEEFCHREDYCVPPGKSTPLTLSRGGLLGEGGRSFGWGQYSSSGDPSTGQFQVILYASLGLIFVLAFLSLLIFILVIKKRQSN